MPKTIIRKSNIRLKDYGYSQSNYYFIIACCENQSVGTDPHVCPIFGAVINDKMILNDAGKMVEQTLLEIPNFYPGFSLNTHITMPNHIHAIITIQNNQLSINGQAQGTVPTQLSLSDIVHRFKTMSTRKYVDGVKNKGWLPFNKKIWQRSFYYHIIRNEASLHKIREYIINNPVSWAEDEENINCITASTQRTLPSPFGC